MIDEVDSFLQDRRDASKSWEVSQVNEMLTQMETYNGIFIASTNLVDNLDQASLRRFDFKFKFDFLRKEQLLKLVAKYCEQLQIAPEISVMHQISMIENLTLGDFAAVYRQHKFRPIKNIENLLGLLIDESKIKESTFTQSTIGFV